MVKKFAFLLASTLLLFPFACHATATDDSNGMNNFHYATPGNQPPNSDNQDAQNDQDTSATQDDDAASDSDADKLSNSKEDTD